MIDNLTYNFIKEAKGEDMEKVSAGVLVICTDTNRVLLQKRADHLNQPDTLGCIGGHLKKGEKPEDGCRREFEEETGYKLDLKMHPIHKSDWKDSVYYNFVSYSPNEFENFKPKPGHEDETKWFAWIHKNELLKRDDLHPGLKDTLSVDGLFNSIFSKGEEDDN